jgi:hypothetical protein
MLSIQHCIICRVSADAWIEPRPGANLAFMASDALTTLLDFPGHYIGNNPKIGQDMVFDT